MPESAQSRTRCLDEDIARAVASTGSIAETLRGLGLCASGANYKFLRRAIACLALDTSHWPGQFNRPSDEQVPGAVAETRSPAEALRRLGLGGSGSHYRFLQRAIVRLSLDTSHWRRPRQLIPDADIARAVADSISIAEVLRRLGFAISGANYAFVRYSVTRLGLDTSHWLGAAHLRGKSHDWTKSIPLGEILVENSSYGSTSRLKERLFRRGFLQPRCPECGISDWRGKPLSLVLDHINGIYDDNRLENLRVLCRNCHSQTPTFAGRNQGRRALALTAAASPASAGVRNV
jgi:5-methylcytosine-specific restriction endonuclease McrA